MNRSTSKGFNTMSLKDILESSKLHMEKTVSSSRGEQNTFKAKKSAVTAGDTKTKRKILMS